MNEKSPTQPTNVTLARGKNPYTEKGEISPASDCRPIMFDLLIRNAQIIDGTGAPAFRGEIGILHGKIEMVHRLTECDDDDSPASAREVIDAEGCTVCPGFVDLHSHADMKILSNPGAESSLLMGVTTEISGNCGNSLAPLSDASARYAASRVRDVRIDWRSMDEFLTRIEEAEVGNNQGLFVGHGTIRRAVMGMEKRFPTDTELQRMKELTHRSMEAGAFGVSTGRAYVPGCFGGFREVAEVTAVAGEYMGLYTSHIADQWTNVHRATWEVVEIGLRTGTPVQVAHQKVVGKDNWGRADEVLAILEDGRDMGADIMADVYPYTYSAVMPLTRALPDKLSGDSKAETLANLRREGAADTIRRAFREEPTYVSSRLSLYGVIQCTETEEYQGMDLGEVAQQMNTDVPGAVHHLLVKNKMQVKVAGIMDEKDVRAIIAHPLVMIGSDSSIRSYTCDRKQDRWPMVHPREYGTFPRILGKYVREEGLLTLEEAVHKMTKMPAERAELADRGVISRGFCADLVVFDPGTIGDRATVPKPCRPPEGIAYVLVNGQVAISGKEMQNMGAGKILRDPQGRMLY